MISSRPSSADYGKFSGQLLAERAAHAAAAATFSSAASSSTTTTATVQRAVQNAVPVLGAEALECLASSGSGRPPRHGRLMTT
jgi:hypothetical protein